MKISLSICVVFLISISSFSQLIINEVLSSNTIGYNGNGEQKYDWVELYNEGVDGIDLSDYFLSDDSQNPQKYLLPEHTILPNEYYIVFCSGENIEGHANFKISKEGETIYLTKGNALEDSLAVPGLLENTSYGTSSLGGYGIFKTPTPLAFNGEGKNCVLNKTILSKGSGFYADSLFVKAISDSDAEIKVTINSTYDYVFSDSLLIKENTEQNNIVNVATNPGFDYRLEGYTEVRANTRGWLPPYSEVKKITTIKVAAEKDHCISSEPTYASYVLNQSGNLPVLSVFMDSSDFFSSATGIYVYGNEPLGNYTQTGVEWERPAYIDFMHPDSTFNFSANVGVRLNGHGSRHSTVKNLRLYARSIYGDNNIETAVFPNIDVNKFETLLLRSGGHRPDCFPRDELAYEIVKELDFDKQSYVYTDVYFNGEYWGVHALKERIDEHFFKGHYNIDSDDLILLNAEANVDHGTESDSSRYDQMVALIAANHPVENDNIPAISEMMDIDNYFDYVISEIFLGNADWPNSNIGFWRKDADETFIKSKHDGRYRWIFYDLDGGFGGSCNDVYVTFNTLEHALQTTESFNGYTDLFIGFMNSDSLRTVFINRTCDLLNSNFLYGITGEKMRGIAEKLNPVMLDQINRWRYPSNATTLSDRENEVPNTDKWYYLLSQFDDYLERRPFYVRKHMTNLWGLSDTALLTVNVNNTNGGEVKVNSLLLNDALLDTSMNVYPWKGIYYKNLPVTLEAIPKQNYKFVRWENLNETDKSISLNLYSDTDVVAIFEYDSAWQDPQILINEIQAKNDNTISDDFGEYNDWVELYNNNDFAVNLKGYFLTNDSLDLTMHSLENDLFIPAHNHLVFWADEDLEQGAQHLPFKLKSAGGYLALVKPDGLSVFDRVIFDELQADESYGRQLDGDSHWVNWSSPTPGEANRLSTAVHAIVDVPNFYVYPNPVENTLKFSHYVNGFVYSITGVLIEEFSNTNTIQTQHYPRGLYLLKTDKFGTVKFIKK